MAAPRILCVGSVNLDCALSLDRFPVPGETTHGDRAVRSPGGKGANQAVAAARAGGRVRLVGAVGDDAAGREVRSALRGRGVDVRGVSRVRGRTTGLAFAFCLPGGEVAIHAVRGAADALRPSDLPRACRIPGDADRVLLTFGASPAMVRHVAAACGRSGVPLQVTPGSVRPALLGDGRRFPAGTLFTPNAHELSCYTGRTVRTVVQARSALRDATRRFGGRWLVTLGPLGCVLPPDEGGAHVPAPRVHAVDTTGAGDCFSGVLAVLLCEGLPMREAARAACRAASISATRWGAVPSMPGRGQYD